MIHELFESISGNFGDRRDFICWEEYHHPTKWLPPLLEHHATSNWWIFGLYHSLYTAGIITNWFCVSHRYCTTSLFGIATHTNTIIVVVLQRKDNCRCAWASTIPSMLFHGFGPMCSKWFLIITTNSWNDSSSLQRQRGVEGWCLVWIRLRIFQMMKTKTTMTTLVVVIMDMGWKI